MAFVVLGSTDADLSPLYVLFSQGYGPVCLSGILRGAALHFTDIESVYMFQGRVGGGRCVRGREAPAAHHLGKWQAFMLAW